MKTPTSISIGVVVGGLAVIVLMPGRRYVPEAHPSTSWEPRRAATNVATTTTVTNVVTVYVNQPSAFHSATYFEDLDVVETVTRKKLTISEVADLIDRLPNVKQTLVHVDPPRLFSLDKLAYPQYFYHYSLSKREFAELQDYCRERLREGIAVDEVLAHWRSIVAGTPPFWLKVRP